GALVIVVSSLATTTLIIWWAVAQRRKAEAALGVLLVVVLLTTMVFGPFSRKNYLPILALPLYALAAFHALRWLFQARRNVAIVLACGRLVAWAIRFGGLGYHLAAAAHRYQEEWRAAEIWGSASEHDARLTGPMIARLRSEALSRAFPDPEKTLKP